jgi:hypothetical protein
MYVCMYVSVCVPRYVCVSACVCVRHVCMCDGYNIARVNEFYV